MLPLRTPEIFPQLAHAGQFQPAHGRNVQPVLEADLHAAGGQADFFG